MTGVSDHKQPCRSTCAIRRLSTDLWTAYQITAAEQVEISLDNGRARDYLLKNDTHTHIFI